MARNALGRGLGALIREPESPFPTPPVVSTVPPTTGMAEAHAVARSQNSLGPSADRQFVDIDLIEPSPYQPRTHFREEALDELSRSITSTGIIQPLVVRMVGSRFQLLAGERRWRAAQRAGLERVPVVVRDVPDEIALEITLVENIQREDLNAIEEARAYERLMNEFHLTQEEVAERTGKERATVGNAVRLLRLERQILDLIEDGRLSGGHGRALLAVADPQLRMTLSQRAARGGLTVRQLERLASRHTRAARAGAAAPTTQAIDPNTRAAIEQLEHSLGARVTIRPPFRKNPGQLIIEYYDEAQLTGLYDRLIGS